MKNTQTLNPGCIYLFKSLSCGNTCYFETENEIKYFTKIFRSKLKKYIQVLNINISKEGYSLILKIRDKRTILGHYKKEREIVKKSLNMGFINEPWRIISEKIRLVHSLFVRFANRQRQRSGVLVKKSYEKIYFENKNEVKKYMNKKEDELLSSQTNSKYASNDSHCEVKCWMSQTKKVLKKLVFWEFKDLILLNLITKTINLHTSP